MVRWLLSTGYHVKQDIADVASSVGARVAEPLGPDELLLTALTARLAEAGVPGDAPVVLAAAGSSDPGAASDVEQQAELLARLRGAPVMPAFATAGRPTAADAAAALRPRTALPVAVW